MANTLEDLKNRRSCRSYQPRQITEEELQQVLEAGMYAPTGMGKQSPVIVAVQDKDAIETLRKMNAAILGAPEADPFYGAPTVLIVLADRSRPTYLYDGSCVMSNLLNAAQAAGLGACWIHRAREEFDSPEGKALLRKWGLPERLIGVGHCILGYPADAPAAPKPRKENYIIRV